MAGKAGLYARYSTDMQREASIEDQLRDCTARAKQEGFEIYNSYADYGISGVTLMRSGIQSLLEDARSGKIDVIITESIDRLSRDQEDIAHIYKRVTFQGVKVMTLSEGVVNELHVGLKGTMGAMYLKDLADKTRRGQKGRIEKGRSAGGNCYGYDVIYRHGPASAPQEAGERAINETEASVIKRIFKAYADGMSPRAIAILLNEDGIKGPFGKGWGASTTTGNGKQVSAASAKPDPMPRCKIRERVTGQNGDIALLVGLSPRFCFAMAFRPTGPVIDGFRTNKKGPLAGPLHAI